MVPERSRDALDKGKAVPSKERDAVAAFIEASEGSDGTLTMKGIKERLE